jgi:branched-subunit amino acid ABC-type transport system permease component
VRQLLPFIVVGITTGSLYGLTGLGLVLTYRTSGIFNFAHGAVAATAAYCFFALHHEHGLSWPPAALISIGLLGPVMGVVLERVTRRLAGARVVMAIVGTAGLLLAVQGLLYVIFGAQTKTFSEFLPTDTITIADVHVSYAQIIKVVVSLVAATALWLFLRRNRLGVTMRAVVDNPTLLDMTGTTPTRVRTVAWVIGASFAALSGVLIAPVLGLDAALLTLLVVQAFGAVAIGRFSSLPLTFIGGIAVGIIASLVTKYLAGRPLFNGLPSAIPFLVLIAVLLITPKARLPQEVGRLGDGASERRPWLPTNLRRAGYAAGFALLLAVPAVVGSRLPVYINGVNFVVIFLSLALLVRSSGQISLCHAAFAALGATTFSHLTVGQGLSWPLALMGAGLVTVPLGAVLAIPAIRLSGLYLALATFGFGILMQNVVFNASFMFGNEPFLRAPRPTLGPFDGANDTTFYYLALAVALLCCLAVLAIDRSRLGRLLRALGDSPTALTTGGLSVNVTRIMVFCLSAFFAGVGGGLFMAQFGQVSKDYGFGPFQSLIWLAVLAISGRTLILPAFIAAGLLTVLPAYITGLSQEWQSVLFGATALAAATVPIADLSLGKVFAGLADRTDHRARRGPVRARTVTETAA